MEPNQEIDIRYTQLGDGPFLKSWLSDPAVSCWMPMKLEKEIEDTAQGWIGFSKYHSSLTATIGEEPCGIGTLFLMPYRKVAHHCLFKIVVDPKHQKKGVGSSLIKNLKNLAKKYFRLENIHIEVFGNNPIIRLLKKQGFEEIARQEKFVKEDGIYLPRTIYQSKL